MSLTVSSANVALADATGAPLAPAPMTFEALATDVGVSPVPSAFASMFPPPDAKMIHVYATALR